MQAGSCLQRIKPAGAGSVSKVAWVSPKTSVKTLLRDCSFLLLITGSLNLTGCLNSKQSTQDDEKEDSYKIYLATDDTPFKAASLQPAGEASAKPALLTNQIHEKVYINGRPVQLPENSPLSAEEFSASLVTSYGTQSARSAASRPSSKSHTPSVF